MGGEPFTIGLPAPQVDLLFETRLREVMGQLAELHWSGDGAGDQISDRMREMRTWDLTARKDTYAESRIHDQQVWYDGKAELNHRRSRQWGLVGLVASMAGLVAGCSVRPSSSIPRSIR